MTAKTKTSLILACGLAFIALPGAFATDTPDAMFKATDTNSDGKLSHAESTAGSKKMFADADTNHDGLITGSELTTAHEKMAEMPAKAHQPTAAEMSAQIIELNDTNKDGKLSAAEHAAGCEAMFTKLDKNRDNALSPEECAEGKKAMMAKTK